MSVDPRVRVRVRVRGRGRRRGRVTVNARSESAPGRWLGFGSLHKASYYIVVWTRLYV